MCHKVCNQKEDAHDLLHDIFIVLVNAAARIDFPDNREESLGYIYKVITNIRNQRYRKSKKLPVRVDLSEASEVADESNSNPHCMRKLEKLDTFIRTSNLFSTDQLKLWECLYEFHSIEEMATILCKRKRIVSTLKKKLFAKICKHFKLEQTY